MSTNEKRIGSLCGVLFAALGIAIIILIHRVGLIQDVVIGDHQDLQTIIQARMMPLTNSEPSTLK